MEVMRVFHLTITAQYERSPSYKKPSLRLACWLYEPPAVGESMNCFYMPSSQAPHKGE
jgi:hypothetical protein